MSKFLFVSICVYLWFHYLMERVFTIAKPENPLPLVFDSPHSGNIYPPDFKPAASTTDLAYAEDSYVGDLFSSAPDHGAALLCALFPRSYIDVNRAVDDIDPLLLAEPYPNAMPSSRSTAGIGLIRRLLKPGVPLYDRTLSSAEIQNRIETYYRPYHKALDELIETAHYNFGRVYHINCHSMPNSTAFPKQTRGMLGHTQVASDFVIGNRDGTTCDATFLHALYDHLRHAGFRVTINDPFKGVEIVQRHGLPTRGRHSLQIEVNKSLYMNEETGEKSNDYDAFKNQIKKLVSFCAAYTNAQLRDLAAD